MHRRSAKSVKKRKNQILVKFYMYFLCFLSFLFVPLHPNLNFIKMKKILLVLIAFSVTCNTFSHGKDPLDLSFEIIDTSQMSHGVGKAPIRMPEIYQDGHTLSFNFNHTEYIINIVQDGEVVLSSVVPADAAQYELPGYVSGECVIQFIWGNYCFWAEIEL